MVKKKGFRQAKARTPPKPVVTEEQRRKSRERHLKYKYGITLEQYEQMFEEQEGKCGCCGKHQDQFKTALHVDHDHKTGEVRGLLCSYCNLRVIGRHRDPNIFLAAADYLTGPFTGWIAPKRKKKRKAKK